MKNEILIVQLKGLLAKYRTELSKLRYPDNEYDYFKFNYIHYYLPFKKHLLELLKNDIKKTENNFEDYKEYILDYFEDAIQQDLIKDELTGNEFLNKLSFDLYHNLNTLLESYKKIDNKLKINFLTQFTNNKNKSFLILLNNNPELYLETVSKLKSPRLQFYYLNTDDFDIKNKLQQYLRQQSDKKLKILLYKYFNYENINPQEYLNQWLGDLNIHVKFARIILENHYEIAKEFLKNKR